MKDFVILTFFEYVVIALVTKVSVFAKIILPYAVDGFIVEILGQSAKFSENFVFPHWEISELIKRRRTPVTLVMS